MSLSHETHEDDAQWDAAKREVQASVAQEVRRRLSQSPDAAEIERSAQRIADRARDLEPIIGG